MKKHIRNMRSRQTDKSSLAAYVWEQGHRIEERKLLKHIQNSSKPNIKKNNIKSNEFLCPIRRKFDFQIYKTTM